MGSVSLGGYRRNLGLIAIAVGWLALGMVGIYSTAASGSQQDCPNGPLMADLSGTAVGGRTPRGTAQYRERGNNALMVMVRSAAAGSTLDVLVGGTSVGQITVPQNGNGQLKVDAPTVAITDGTTIEVRNGMTVVLSGTFRCVAGRGRGNTNANTNGNTNENTNVNVNGNTNVNGNANVNGNTNANTNANGSPSPTMMP